jgi:hypothetical protein
MSLHEGNVKSMASVSIPIDVPPADFTTAESDAAVTLFGCDCSSCISALRRVRSQSLLTSGKLNSGKGHCWTALQQRVSPEELQTVLQTLEAEESK